MGDIADNVARVRARIESAAVRAGRAGADITFVAVTKKQPASALLEAAAAGVAEVGENYVQETTEKQSLLQPSQIQAVRWHLLGHLQSNKAKAAVSLFGLIQSVDSAKLARALSVSASAVGKTQAVLLQVHLGNEETKFGVSPAEALDAAAEIAALPGLSFGGLMGIAPSGEDARPHFQTLRRLFDALPTGSRQTLSMGMTNDFETAIEEGATMVRVGTAIFGARH